MTTIKDVAERAGVTVTTVSRVLNNRGKISSKTREKVNQVMKELDYHPNEMARSLFRKKSNIIGLILPMVSHPFLGEMAYFIEYYAYMRGYKILLCNSQMDRDKENEYLVLLKKNKVDGIIMGSHTTEVDEYIGLELPIVTFDRVIGENIPFVTSDNFEGGRLATEHLIECGCKKIAHITGNLSRDLLANKRTEAFFDVVRKHSIEHVLIQADLNIFDLDGYTKLFNDFFADHSDVDGVFATSYAKAAYFIKAGLERKIKIPERIKVVGYDDYRISSMFLPHITSIRQPVEQMCELLVDLIISQINKEPIQRENCFPVNLVKRQTT